MPPTSPLYRFDDAELRPAARELRIRGEPAYLGDRGFDVLLALVEHRDRMLSKHELLDLAWPGLVVEEYRLQVQVGTLRKLLGPKAIVMVPGRGYRFGAELIDAAPLPAQAPAASPIPLAADAGNLPADLPPLLGRDVELRQLQALLPRHRLVSVTGPGGIGKTSLARTAAQRVAPAFRDGVWMVALAPIADPAAVAGAIADALQIVLPGRGDPAEELAARLRGGELIVLDNCEHLIGGVAALVTRLLALAPGLHVLATSQEPLKLAGEQLLRLATLEVPSTPTLADAERCGALALLVARIAAVQPGFRLAAGDLGDAVEICRQLDGMPLALELAAARVPLLGLAGVRRHLADRLRLFTNSTRDAPSRQRTLGATLDWSHALLGAEEQAVFRRLAVFVGGFGLELAQALAADAAIDGWSVLDHLGALVDKSIVVADPGSLPRYRLLETTRAYALAKLEAAGELEAMRRRHAACLLEAVDRRSRIARLGPETMDQWLLACGPEIDNLRSAIEWACGAPGERQLALDLVNAAARLMYQAGRYLDSVRWVRMAEPLIDDDTPAVDVAQFRWSLALVGLHGGVSAPQRLALLAQAIPVFEAAKLHGQCVLALCMQGYVGGTSGDFALADRSLDAARETIERFDLRMLRTSWLFALGMVRRYEDRPAEAIDAYLQALPLARAEGDARMVFYLLNNLAAMHQELGRVDEAVMQFRAVVDHLQRSPMTDAQMMAFALVWLAHALTVQGALDEAEAAVRRSLPYCRRSIGVRHFGDMLALLAARRGRAREAALLIGCDDAARERRGELRTAADERTLAMTLAALAPLLPTAQLAAWRTEGALLDEESAAALCVPPAA